MSTHLTSGGWKFDEDLFLVDMGDGQSLSLVGHGLSIGELKRTGRLIAAAPELLEALEDCLEDLKVWLDGLGAYQGPDGGIRYSPHDCNSCSTCEAIAKAKAAIAKAKGEA